MEFVNLTPHALNIHSGGKVITLPPSGIVARVAQTFQHDYLKSQEFGIDIFETNYGEVENLPEPKQGIIFIVSGLVKQAVKRQDVLSPGELVRDSQGRPTGCKGLRA